MKTFTQFIKEAGEWWKTHDFPPLSKSKNTIQLYQDSLNKLQNSRWFKYSKINNPEELNLSIGQLKELFGTDLQKLFDLDIIKKKTEDAFINSLTNSGSSYALYQPK